MERILRAERGWWVLQRKVIPRKQKLCSDADIWSTPASEDICPCFLYPARHGRIRTRTKQVSHFKTLRLAGLPAWRESESGGCSEGGGGYGTPGLLGLKRFDFNYFFFFNPKNRVLYFTATPTQRLKPARTLGTRFGSLRLERSC